MVADGGSLIIQRARLRDRQDSLLAVITRLAD
jgi:hypothetical protein